jgi:hypothetical protein
LLTHFCLALLSDCSRRCSLFISKLMCFSPYWTLRLQVSLISNRFFNYVSVLYLCWSDPLQFLVRSTSGLYRLTFTWPNSGMANSLAIYVVNEMNVCFSRTHSIHCRHNILLHRRHRRLHRSKCQFWYGVHY